MAQAYDTLEAAKQLVAAGMERRQAEAVAGAIRAGQGDLVTRDYLDAKLEVSLARLERRMMVFGIAVAGALFAALRYL